MAYISAQSGYLLLFIFGFTMLAVSYIWKKHKGTSSDFLLADRRLGWFEGGLSIAASWIWAPALFVSTQVAYQKGLAGLFWFTVPNVLALMLFAALGPKIRELFPEGYTLPQFIRKRLGSRKLHLLYLFPYFFYQLMAVTVQLFAGGHLIMLLTGIPLMTVMPILLVIALSYTLISGLRASVLTDVIQLLAILMIGAVILPMAWVTGGGWTAISAGFSGTGQFSGLFDPGVAFSFGIVTAIGLIAGAVSDQQYWQRTFALKKEDLKKAFIFGSVLFAMVPVGLSILGFLAVSPDSGIALADGADTSMIGVQTVATLLPRWALVLFTIMLFSGLSSTLDSGLSAVSSLWVTDIRKDGDERQKIRSARLAMTGIGLLGLGVAYLADQVPGFGLQHLWWIFNTIAACILVPTILSLYKKDLNPNAVFWGVLVAFVLGIPLFVYSNIIDQPVWIVGSALFVVIVSSMPSLLFKICYNGRK